jgi:hypothetical protein
MEGRHIYDAHNSLKIRTYSMICLLSVHYGVTCETMNLARSNR